jgi:C4-dicarboxylate-specific signal transduction histidine kinase
VNLLLNAAQSLPEGAADRHEVCLSIRPNGAAEAVLEVRDTGAGIAPEILAHVFDPFFTTKRAGEGIGLGLAISYEIAHELGGELRACNQPQGGACFEVVLPL